MEVKGSLDTISFFYLAVARGRAPTDSSALEAAAPAAAPARCRWTCARNSSSVGDPGKHARSSYSPALESKGN